jgi:hypothetical protein
MKRRLALALLLVAVGLGFGCPGYSTHSLFRPDIKTVYVQAFDNKTFRRGLEVPLTRDIVEEIKLRTPLLFAARDEADSVLSGELVDFSLRTQVKSKEEQVLITSVSAKVRFRWMDRLTGMDIVPPQDVEDSVRIALALEPSQEDLVFREIAKRIVERMQEPW